LKVGLRALAEGREAEYDGERASTGRDL